MSKQVWIVANPWTYENEDGNSPDVVAVCTTYAAAMGYIGRHMNYVDQVNANIWGPVPLIEEETA